MTIITYDQFEQVDIRSATIIKAEEFPQAKKSVYKIWADFGPDLGILQTAAQVTANYTTESLVGRSILGCVNLGDKSIAGFKSQFLILAFDDEAGAGRLVMVDGKVPNGRKIS